MEQHAAAYDTWWEAERLANSAERALNDALAKGDVAPTDLVEFVRQRRRDATASLLKWLQMVEGAASIGIRPLHR